MTNPEVPAPTTAQRVREQPGAEALWNTLPEVPGCYSSLAALPWPVPLIPGVVGVTGDFDNRTWMLKARAYEERWRECVAEIEKAKQQFTRGAKALDMPDLGAEEPINALALTWVDITIERSEVLRDLKSKSDFQDQRIAALVTENETLKKQNEAHCRYISKMEKRCVELKRGFDARAVQAPSASEPSGRDSAQTAPAQGA